MGLREGKVLSLIKGIVILPSSAAWLKGRLTSWGGPLARPIQNTGSPPRSEVPPSRPHEMVHFLNGPLLMLGNPSLIRWGTFLFFWCGETENPPYVDFWKAGIGHGFPCFADRLSQTLYYCILGPGLESEGTGGRPSCLLSPSSCPVPAPLTLTTLAPGREGLPLEAVSLSSGSTPCLGSTLRLDTCPCPPIFLGLRGLGSLVYLQPFYRGFLPLIM